MPPVFGPKACTLLVHISLVINHRGSTRTDLFEERMAHRGFQIVFFLCVLITVAFVTGTTFYANGVAYGTSWNDVSMLESVWQAWTLILDSGVQYYTLHTPNR